MEFRLELENELGGIRIGDRLTVSSEGVVTTDDSIYGKCDICNTNYSFTFLKKCKNDHFYHSKCAENYVNESQCPICEMLTYKNDELIEYLLKSHNFNMKSLFSHVKNRFENDYNKFKDFLEGE